MAKTRAEIEGWKSKETDDIGDVISVEIINDPVQAIKQLKPVDGLNLDAFVDDLAKNMQDVDRYSGVISGWFGRMRLNRQMRHVQLFEQYLVRAREASNSAAELQATLLKNKIIFQFQAQIAAQRVKEEWLLEQKGREYQVATFEADIAHKKFMQKFFETTDPTQLSETALMLLNMMQPLQLEKSSSFTSESGGVATSEKTAYGSIEGMARLKQQNQLMEILMQEMVAGVGDKKAQTRKTIAEAGMTEDEAAHKKWRFDKEKGNIK